MLRLLWIEDIAGASNIRVICLGWCHLYMKKCPICFGSCKWTMITQSLNYPSSPSFQRLGSRIICFLRHCILAPGSSWHLIDTFGLVCLAHRVRVCVRVLIWVSVRVYYACLCCTVYFSKKVTHEHDPSILNKNTTIMWHKSMKCVTFTTRKSVFVVSTLSGAQQRASSLWAFHRAHGEGKAHHKLNLCRAFFVAHNKLFFHRPLANRGVEVFCCPLLCVFG
jgi:hypothetical protein